MKKIEFIIERTNDGYSAYAKEYPVYTVGSSMSELKANMVDAFNTFLELKENPLITEEELKITLDLSQFFTFYKEINSKALASRIGMNESLLSQYVNGQKKPSEKQLDKILNGIRSLGRELAAIDLL